MFTHTLRVRFRDCDMFSHVNHVVYLTYFEEARLAAWQELTGDDQSRLPFILAEATCTYRAPATLGDTLHIYVIAGELRERSFVFEYRIDDATTGKLIATGRTVQVCYDYTAKTSLPISAALRAQLQAFAARYAQTA